MTVGNEDAAPSARAGVDRRATTLRWFGFTGAVLLTIAVHAGDVAPLRWLADLPVAALAAAVSAVGFVVVAWALLGRLVLAGPCPRPRWLRRTLALWSAPLLLTPPLFSGDVHIYIAQGEIAARGLDPYSLGAAQALGPSAELTLDVSDYWRETPSPYGPLFGAVERVIAQLTDGSVLPGIVAYRVLAVLGLALVVWAVPKLAERAGVPASAALWLGVLNPLVLWHFVGGMHNDALMLGLMLSGAALAVTALTDRLDPVRLAAGVGLIGLAASVKVPAAAALAVVGVLLARRWAGGRPHLGHLALAALAMGAALLAVLGAVSLASGFGFSWLDGLSTPGAVNSWMAPTNWFGFLVGGVGALFGATITQSMIELGKTLGAVLAVLGLARLVWTALRAPAVEPVRVLGITMALLLLGGPVVQPWYVLWAAIPLAACLAPGRPRLALAGLVGIVAVALPPLGGNFSGKIVELVAGYAVAVVVTALAALALRRLTAP